jgi:ABC-type amino acid transport substrate-binding protein
MPLSCDCLEAVAKSEGDVASNDLINLTLLRKVWPSPSQYEIIDIGDRFPPKPFAVAVKKGHQSLVELLNQAIEALKANGEIDRLMNENIQGLTQPDRTLTAAQRRRRGFQFAHRVLLWRGEVRSDGSF